MDTVSIKNRSYQALTSLIFLKCSAYCCSSASQSVPETPPLTTASANFVNAVAADGSTFNTSKLDFKDEIIITQNDDYKKICPKKVISMNLDNVGGKTGINYNNIGLINNIYPDAEIIISGGVANTEDILEAKVNNYSEIILLTAILEKNIIYSKL